MLSTLKSIIERDYFLLQSARAVAFPHAWEELSGNEKLLWGIQRSKRNTYQTVVDLRHEKPGFQCSCRSRKSPCRHAIALLILLLEYNDAFIVNAEPPEDIQKWLTRRDNRLQPKDRTEEEEAKLAAIRQANRDKRLQQMQSGLDELEIWLHDSIRAGMASFVQQPETYWQEWSAKLVAAKMKGVAKRLEHFPSLLMRDDWQDVVLNELGNLYLLVRAFRNLDAFSEDFQQELFQIIGVNIKKEEVLAEAGVIDTWKVLAIEEGEEDKLRFQRTWLYGGASELFALHLEFVWGRADFQTPWRVGEIWEGAAHFYPAALPQRALFSQLRQVDQAFSLKGIPNFAALQQDYTTVRSRQPWLHLFPCALEQVYIIRDKDDFFLLDEQQQQLSLTSNLEIQLWQLFGLSCGAAIGVFGIWEGRTFKILAGWKEGRWVHF
ncbi:MAG: SWIM zinc finger family protein [Bacteroidota bacterium]